MRVTRQKQFYKYPRFAFRRPVTLQCLPEGCLVTVVAVLNVNVIVQLESKFWAEDGR